MESTLHDHPDRPREVEQSWNKAWSLVSVRHKEHTIRVKSIDVSLPVLGPPVSVEFYATVSKGAKSACWCPNRGLDPDSSGNKSGPLYAITPSA